MKTRIGLIGPEDSIQRILESSVKFQDMAEFVPRIYDRKEESCDLVRQTEGEVDVFLFSGIVPYRIVTYSNATTRPCLYLPRLGTSVIRPLWEMRDRGESYRRISVDSIDKADVQEAADELGLHFDKLEAIEYEPGTSYEDLAGMHEALYRSGTIEVALTGLAKTHAILSAKGIRCYRIFPTKYLIREYIQKAIFISEAMRLRAYQIAQVILRLRSGKSEIRSEYDYLKLKNSFETILIDYAKRILGSVFPYGRDEYLIFTTLGALEEAHGLQELFRGADGAGISFCAGLGYGTTAFNAEANARKALNRACTVNGSCLYSVDVDGGIEGPISSQLRSIQYNIAETDATIRLVAEKTGLSTAYVTKIRAMMRMAARTRFDVDEFATGLDISPRSARRILQNIAEAGYADIVALESRSRTGRPRRVYELKL